MNIIAWILLVLGLAFLVIGKVTQRPEAFLISVLLIVGNNIVIRLEQLLKK